MTLILAGNPLTDTLTENSSLFLPRLKHANTLGKGDRSDTPRHHTTNDQLGNVIEAARHHIKDQPEGQNTPGRIDEQVAHEPRNIRTRRHHIHRTP
ncbi:hypothetical protein [Variovorax sp.]|uniref:hypothetical protein n=1 Tax=Variovorax sp. TaxID=1871043 RepID=UPI004037C87D